MEEDHMVEVDRVVAEYQLDESAVEALQSLPPHLAMKVVGILRSIKEPRNPSAVVTREAAKVQREEASRPHAPTRVPVSRRGEEDGAMDIDTFGERNALEESVMSLLRSADPAVSAEVISRLRVIQGARNPNAIVTTEIRKVEESMRTRPERFSGRDDDIEDAMRDFISRNNLDDRTKDTLRTTPSYIVMKLINRMGTIQGARNPSAVVMSELKRLLHDHSTLIENFCHQNNLDLTVEDELRAAPIDVAQQVMEELGVVKGARNPSALVVSHLRKHHSRGRSGRGPPERYEAYPTASTGAVSKPSAKGLQSGRSPGGSSHVTSHMGMAQRELRNFCDMNRLGHDVEESLRKQPPAIVRKLIMQLGVIQGARNVNAVVVSALKRLLQEEAPLAPIATVTTPSTIVTIGEFVSANRLDAACEASLRKASPGVVDELIARLQVIQGARNPNAVVSNELRKAEAAAKTTAPLVQSLPEAQTISTNTSSVCPLSTEEIYSKTIERFRAIQSEEYQTAKEIKEYLTSCNVELNDFEWSWKTTDGRNGAQTG